jgi:hypothetical protein
MVSNVIFEGVDKFFIGFYRIHISDKRLANLAPLSTVGVSDQIVSVATGFLRQCTFKAGKRDLKCLRNGTL